MKILYDINYLRLFDWSSLKSSDISQLEKKINLFFSLLSEKKNYVYIWNSGKVFNYRIFDEYTIFSIKSSSAVNELSDRTKILLELIGKKMSKHYPFSLSELSDSKKMDEQIIELLRSVEEKVYCYNSAEMVDYFKYISKIYDPIIFISFSNYTDNPFFLINYEQINYSLFDQKYLERYWLRVFNARDEILGMRNYYRCDTNDESSFPHIHFEKPKSNRKEALNLIDKHFINKNGNGEFRLWKHHAFFELSKDIIMILEKYNFICS